MRRRGREPGVGSPPPRLARAILRRLLPGADAEWLLADLHERYQARRRRRGRLSAVLWYWRQTLDFIFRWGAWSPSTPVGCRRSPEGRPDPWWPGTADSLLQDLRSGLRTLRRSQGLAAVVVLILGTGIGASVGIFSVVEAVLLRPLPYREPGRLVLLWHRTAAGGGHLPVPAPDVAEFRRRSRAFEGFAFTDRVSDAALQTDRGAEHLRLGGVDSGFFSLLGVEAALGRTFVAGEGLLPPEALENPEVRAPPGVVLLGHGLWRRRFGADPGILGRRIRVDGRLLEVVGVLPETFELLVPPGVGLPRRIDAWTPLPVPLADLRRPERMVDQDSDNTGAVIGRLADGVTVEQASAEMEAIAAGLRREVPSYAAAGLEIDVEPMHRDVVAHVRPLLLGLWGAVGFVLLIGCANVASLLLARAAERRHEFAVRTALGAGRWRLVRQSLTESLVLGTVAAVLGLGLAWAVVETVPHWSPAALPRMEAVGLDATVLAFAVVVALAVTLVAGLVPALAAARTEAGVGSRPAAPARWAPGAGAGGWLRSPASGGPGDARLRRGLTLAEVALSVLLLVGAGLMLRTFVTLQAVDPGFRPEGVLAFDLSLRHPERYSGPADRARLVRRIEERLRALPEVVDAGLGGHLPLSARRWSRPYGLDGQAIPDWSSNEAEFRMVTSGYLPTLRVDLLAGRHFTPDEDLHEERRVVIVDRRMARRIAPDGDPLGRRIGFPLDGDPVWAEVVGVVGDVRSETLRREGRETIYVPYRQEASRDVSMVVRTSRDAAALAGSVRRALREIDRELPVYDVRPLADSVDEALSSTRFALTLAALFAAAALLLATVGLYGVLAWQVSRRTREIGLRVALGARPGDVARAILGEGLTVAVPGVGVGLLASAGLLRFLRGLLFGVAPLDPATFSAAAGLMLATAALASWLPARRAARVDPLVVLRGRPPR